PWHHRTPSRRRWWLPLLLVPGLPIVLAGQVPAQSARRGTLTGQVLGETGGPLAEADVVVDSAWHARTDPQGGFHLRGIPLGLHLLQVRAAMTNVLIRAALGQRLAGDSPSENAGSSTRCTMVVWERE
ncbi:MAG: carboxypeptidase-like regulatory domain-containing protein, partial [Gemmatimonadales bacterium]